MFISDKLMTAKDAVISAVRIMRDDEKTVYDVYGALAALETLEKEMSRCEELMTFANGHIVRPCLCDVFPRPRHTPESGAAPTARRHVVVSIFAGVNPDPAGVTWIHNGEPYGERVRRLSDGETWYANDGGDAYLYPALERLGVGKGEPFYGVSRWVVTPELPALEEARIQCAPAEGGACWALTYVNRYGAPSNITLCREMRAYFGDYPEGAETVEIVVSKGRDWEALEDSRARCLRTSAVVGSVAPLLAAVEDCGLSPRVIDGEHTTFGYQLRLFVNGEPAPVPDRFRD
jgi:hypothetical protein